ncbi:hypothetical protein O6H91_09G049400 [Diphasiastrum complanatum]|uniref:Uncharacterized protein n=1 Tax=Diphasiastrum complanatum TaxID=34168 RepID=A0ACC2CNU9_DIPCM|nr:hypothetical protein O6H91_09G049400 [Diphasiastrum complanatum]
MGKKAAVTPEEGTPTGGSATGSGELDARTVFVRKLPFSLSDSQLEELFSEVGPVKHCFTVKEKGSDQHRGFGFIQFAVAEDAQKAVESKNGLLLQGRKIKVELAKRRASLDERRRRRRDGHANDEVPCASGATGDNTGDKVLPDPTDDAQKKRKRADFQQLRTDGLEPIDILVNKKPKQGKLIDAKSLASKIISSSSEAVQSSVKQRFARTVIVGGIGNSKVLKGVLAVAKKAGSVETTQNSLTKEELDFHNVAKDGCKLPAASVVYTSVRSANQAVAALHQQQVKGCLIWARQLGGEGSKLKKWRLIVRNLPFQVKEETLRELFSAAGFVWEITIPRKADGLSRGFAFVGYTSKSDAEKAIKTFNGKSVGKRPVAVDWAVGKKQFETLVSKLDAEPSSGDHQFKVVSDLENDTASEEDEDSISEVETDDDYSEGESVQEDEVNVVESVEPVNVPEEVDLVHTVLNKIVAQSANETGPNLPAKNAHMNHDKKHSKQGADSSIESDIKKSHNVNSGKLEKPAETKNPAGPLESSTVGPAVGNLQKTVFIRNLPLDANVTDLRKRFSAFGIVKSLRLVLHPMTRRPKGTAFLEFDTQNAAQDAVSAAKESEEGKTGLLFGGRVLVVNFAVERNEARDIAKQKFMQEHHDRRNLYLSKEGVIQEGAPAAAGVSKGDIVKRKLLESEKATKLRSPNFHVSTTRLAIHNLPKTTTEKEVKKLFIEAVMSRASKQKPIIKQVKILREGEKSRGAGFVEFSEHQHALVALRVLNNNPDVFGTERRPIVEFAIENTLKLRERASRLASAKTNNHRNGMNIKQTGLQKKKIDKQVQSKDHTDTGDRVSGHEPEVIGKTPKRSKSSTPGPENPLSSKKSPKNRSFSKKRKVESNSSNSIGISDTLSLKDVKGLSQADRLISHGKKRIKNNMPRNGPALDNGKGPPPAKAYTSQGKDNQTAENVSEPSKKASRKKDHRKATASKLEDKLDKLVTEYRSKYFSHTPGTKNPGNGIGGLKRTSENLKRWFD